ncbi:MAG TPA: GNAT family N-acetyltransferase [Gemmataceae bacterium]|nr:GNAT family N-acetyltransferase [Gemmataceae bacterium]
MKDLESLQTPHLHLSRMTADDLDDLTRMHLDPRVMATLGGVRSAEQTRDWLERQMGHWERCGFGLWMARERQTGQFAGRGGLHYIEIDGREEIEVGYCFLPDFWGRGLATELARESIRAGFSVLNAPELVCFTLTTNHASQRVMQKAGFRYSRDLLYKDLPHVLYRLRREEWQPARFVVSKDAGEGESRREREQ